MPESISPKHKSVIANVYKPIAREIHIDVIRNGRMDAHWSDTPRGTLKIGRRALETMILAQRVDDVQQLYWIAQ